MAGNGAKTLEKPASAGAFVSADQNQHATGEALFHPPYRLRFVIEGVSPILFHRYDCEAVDVKSKAAKGSASKKTDDVDSYYYRDTEGHVCIAAPCVHGALINSGRWVQDPRSSRKSAMDLVKAGILVEPDLIPTLRDGKKIMTAEFLDKRPVCVNRSRVPRVRPALQPGWQAELLVTVLAPDLMEPMFVRELMARAGSLVGIHDMRPQYGRFAVISAAQTEF